MGRAPGLAPSTTWLHRWIYTLAAGLLFAAVSLRAILIFQPTPYVGRVLLILGAWLALFMGDFFLSRRRSWLTILFLTLEAGLTLYTLIASNEDFFAFLFVIIDMQAMQRFSPRWVALLIGLFALLTYFSLVGVDGVLQALALALIYAGVGAFMAAYIWSVHRAGVAREQQQALVEELQAANQQLELHARQQEQLAAAQERLHLARELHDSVTQTIFSMTLAAQSAQLLLERDRTQVSAQLDRLDELASGAMAEMQVLISQLAPSGEAGGGFLANLQRHLQERRRLDGLAVELAVEGDGALGPAEASGLFRIAREALNNIVKHAGVSQAVVRLHFTEPFWMQIEDCGLGFDPDQSRQKGRLGLPGMSERAAEIGWTLRVESAHGQGTRVRVERSSGGEKK
jgi:signal transduction histidine kinase